MIELFDFIRSLERLKRLAGSACSPTFSRELDTMLINYKTQADEYERHLEQEEHF
jgi:hypothetical protein